MVSLYYHTDQNVEEDLELQAWIKDITEEGFTELPNFGKSFLVILYGNSCIYLCWKHANKCPMIKPLLLASSYL